MQIKFWGSTRLSLHLYTIIRFLKINFRGSNEIHEQQNLLFSTIWHCSVCYHDHYTAKITWSQAIFLLFYGYYVVFFILLKSIFPYEMSNQMLHTVVIAHKNIMGLVDNQIV